LPYQTIINCRIGVYDDISEGNDSRQIRNGSCNGRVQAAQANECFPDDLELAFDGSSQHSIAEIIVKILAGGELNDVVDRGLGVP